MILSLPFRSPAGPTSRPALLPAAPGLLLLASLLVGAGPRAAVASSDLVPGDADEWVRVEFPDFTMISNAGEDETLELGREVARLQGVLDMIVTDEHGAVRPPLRMYVFDDADDFTAYKPYYQGRPANVAGWFVSTVDGGYLAVDASKRSRALPTLYHELVHAWLAANQPLAPLWVHEGLAEFYSSFEVDGDEVVIGRPLEHHLETLRRGRLFSSARLMDLSPEDPEYNEGLRQSKVYAQSWALMHMVFTNKERRNGLLEFLRLVHDGMMPALALERGFGVPFEQLEKELRDYLQLDDHRFYRLRAGDDEAVRAREVQELDELEALIELGDLASRLSNGRPGLAEEHFAAALALDSTAARAHRGLAVVRTGAGDVEGALAALDRALELDDEDALAHTQKGVLLVDRWMRAQTVLNDTRTDSPPVDLGRARGHFERALELRPDHAPALAGLGATYLMGRDPQPGIEALEAALARLPWRVDLLAQLVRLRANADDFEGARTLLDENLRRHVRADAAVDFAEAAVVDAELREVDRRLEAGRLTEAGDLVARAYGQSTNDAMRRFLHETLGRMGAPVAVKSGDHEVDRYNEAVVAARGGRIEEALEIVRDLATNARREDVRRESASLLESLEEGARALDAKAVYDEALDLVQRNRVDEARALLRGMLEGDLDPEIEEQVRAFLDELGG